MPGATSRLLGHPSNILVYSVGDRNFAYFKTSEPERWRFSIRVSPDRFVELTDIPGIKPARFRARYHWVTIVDVRSVPAAYLAELVEWSYNKALNSLSKRRRIELLDMRKPASFMESVGWALAHQNVERWAKAHPTGRLKPS
nr:MmcQ/YjbR family DNA-binding protein [Lysobacter sp. CFH 32150]